MRSVARLPASTVKSRVEAGDLREAWEVRSDRLNAGDLVRQVQRCKGDQASQFVKEGISDRSGAA